VHDLRNWSGQGGRTYSEYHSSLFQDDVERVRVNHRAILEPELEKFSGELNQLTFTCNKA
jgi:hypothetical protein